MYSIRNSLSSFDVIKLDLHVVYGPNVLIASVSVAFPSLCNITDGKLIRRMCVVTVAQLRVRFLMRGLLLGPKAWRLPDPNAPFTRHTLAITMANEQVTVASVRSLTLFWNHQRGSFKLRLVCTRQEPGEGGWVGWWSEAVHMNADATRKLSDSWWEETNDKPLHASIRATDGFTEQLHGRRAQLDGRTA